MNGSGGPRAGAARTGAGLRAAGAGARTATARGGMRHRAALAAAALLLGGLPPGILLAGGLLPSGGGVAAPPVASGPVAGQEARSDTADGDTVAAAIFAGGCFWCMEPPFDELEGVLSTVSGYTGGSVADPTYEQVSSGGTGHYEAVRVLYDPRKVGYGRLLEAFWRNVDPLDAGGQFCDRGDQYRSALFPIGEEQRRLAEASKREVEDRFAEPVATEILPATVFYPAEEYHQDYYRKNPVRYKLYKFGCGRDRRLERVWGDEGE